jgi:glycine/D-amino acid oxidase-like deaminating enzyme
MTEGDTLSYWADTAPRYKPDPSDLPAKADVVVVGGGYTGISAARVMAERGASVTLLEARDLGWGASTRNAGMMIVGLKHGPQVLVKQFGEELGRKLFDTTLEANRFVEEMINREQIDCEYGRVGHLTAAFRAKDYDSLEREAEFLDHRFGHQAKMVSRADMGGEIGSSFYHGGVIDDASAGLHPAKYFAGLARLADRAGAKLHPNTPATSVERVNGEFVVRTPRGEVRAKDILVATNGYTPDIFPEFQRRVIPMGSYIVATEPLDPSTINRVIPKNRMVIDTKHVLYYFRRTADNRLLFGGRASFSPTTVERSRDILRGAIRKVYPELGDVRIDYAWKGNVAFTFDLLPHVGRHKNGMHYAIGFCGHGVAMGSYLGSRMGAMIASSEAPALPFFSLPFPAKFFYRGTPWFLPIVGTWYRFLDAI